MGMFLEHVIHALKHCIMCVKNKKKISPPPGAKRARLIPVAKYQNILDRLSGRQSTDWWLISEPRLFFSGIAKSEGIIFEFFLSEALSCFCPH